MVAICVCIAVEMCVVQIEMCYKYALYFKDLVFKKN